MSAPWKPATLNEILFGKKEESQEGAEEDNEE